MTDQRITSALDAQPAEGTLAEIDGAWVLTMTREYGYPPERLWSMLTDPERLARWSPIVPDRALDRVGPARSQESPDMPEVDAEVLVCDPPHLLVHRWGSQLLRWTLTPTAGGTTLTLANTLDEPDTAARNAGGWHLCLAVLAAGLADPGVQRVVGPDALAYGWQDIAGAYEKLLGA
jgi:uncharacterized protein YndB with AHSA1/START domain